MGFTEKDLEEFQKRELKPADTFRFECSMCGNCCRNRDEPILLTGADIFRIARALGVPVEPVILKNTHWYIGDASHVPVLVLKERLDGSCSFLRNGRCTVQQDKPAVCALYPLGRYFDVRDNTFHYFFNQPCQNGSAAGQKWTLQEWLDHFKVEETEAMTAVWHKLLIGITQITRRISKQKIKDTMLDELFRLLYLNYNIGEPYAEQVEQNMRIAQDVFPKKFHQRIRF